MPYNNIIVLLIFCIILFLIIKNFSNVLKFLTDITDTRKKVYYKLHDSNLDPNFTKITRGIIKNSKWAKLYNLVDAVNSATSPTSPTSPTPLVNIYLKSELEMKPYHDNKQYHSDGSQIKFSITYKKDGADPVILINYGNWKNGVKQSKLSVMDYRTYVINHELGHALGMDHLTCEESTAINGVCPVMYQSTRGCNKFKCGINPSVNDYNAPKLNW